jgi:hypothetical protein
MAIKGNGYIKTSWGYQERPVASSKLNQWDDRIEAGLELVFFFLNQAWGGGNGVIRCALPNDMKVAAKGVPTMTVVVNPGYAFISSMPYKAAVTELAVTLPPVTHARIDLVEAKLSGWQPVIKQGVESATLQPPAPDTDCIALAELYLRPGMTCIKNTDDGVNGYIIDMRTFL